MLVRSIGWFSRAHVARSFRVARTSLLVMACGVLFLFLGFCFRVLLTVSGLRLFMGVGFCHGHFASEKERKREQSGREDLRS